LFTGAVFFFNGLTGFTGKLRPISCQQRATIRFFFTTSEKETTAQHLGAHCQPAAAYDKTELLSIPSFNGMSNAAAGLRLSATAGRAEHSERRAQRSRPTKNGYNISGTVLTPISGFPNGGSVIV